MGQFTFLTTFEKVSSHTVEGVNENAEFITGNHIDAEIKVAIGDLLGRQSKFVDRSRDILRQKEPEPDWDESDQSRNQDKSHDIVTFNIDLQVLSFFVSRILFWDILHL